MAGVSVETTETHLDLPLIIIVLTLTFQIYVHNNFIVNHCEKRGI